VHALALSPEATRSNQARAQLRPSPSHGLAKGTYRFYVTATDSVGYKSVKAGVGKLVVK
jgi:hypothetical protein